MIEQTIDILVAGDFFPQDEVAALIDQEAFDSIFREITPIVQSVDYSILNFEGTIAEKDDKPILKDGPNLKMDVKAIDTIKYIGFNCCTLANNHTLDYGGNALLNTISLLDKNGLDHVGAGKCTQDASKILFVTVKGKKIAIISCCEYEYTIATSDLPGANHANPIAIFYQIQKAKNDADIVLVINHGGAEFQQLPSPRMQEQFRFYIDIGADAVINHHQHCFSGYEFYKNKPIVYGLGNFCFSKVGKINDTWNEGYMVKLSFAEDQISLKTIPYYQCNGAPSIQLRDRKPFEEKIRYLNSIIADSEQLKCQYKEWMENHSGWHLNVLLPYRDLNNSRKIKILKKLRLLPDISFTQKLIQLLNCLRCESHLERSIAVLNNYISRER